MNMKLSFLPALALLFIGLKLGGIVSWSWWWVLCPLYALPVIAIGVFMFALLCAVVALWFTRSVIRRGNLP